MIKRGDNCRIYSKGGVIVHMTGEEYDVLQNPMLTAKNNYLYPLPNLKRFPAFDCLLYFLK